MLGLGKPTPVSEREAEGEIERVYHEIRQVLRVTGVNLNFRTWASFDKFLPAMWDAMRGNAGTQAFERAADLVRAEAMRGAEALGLLGAAAETPLGESQTFQLMKAVELYHTINPKLLVFTAAVLRALEHGPLEAGAAQDAAPLPRGIPPKMFPMEMVEEEPEDERLQRLFGEIKETFSLSHINSDYRTLALWPEYLEAAWEKIRPLAQGEAFQRAAEAVCDMARYVALTLPHPVPLSRQLVEDLGEDAEQVVQTTRKFEQLLGPLIVVIALCKRDWRAPHAIAAKLGGRIVAPAADNAAAPPRADSGGNGSAGGNGERRTADQAARPASVWREPWREFQRRQRAAEVGDHFLSYIDEGEGEPVVLLHGIPTWGFLWHQLIPELARTHRVLAPDLAGFGFSDKSDRFDRSASRQMVFLDLWMDELGIQRAHWVAHDLGGAAALRLATLLPHRVASLCLMNSVCYDAWPVEAMLQLGHPQVWRKLSAGTVQSMLRKTLPQGGFAAAPSEELLEGLLAPYATEVGKLSLIRDAAALNTNLTTELTGMLPQITAPTSILWGEEDLFLPVKYGERLAWDIPGARLTRIPHAAHFVMLDQPEETARQVQTHLKMAATAASAAAR